jgi:NAD(P)-dependent dehydrogenase (short-subunit alcohol dehydrogenase family)
VRGLSEALDVEFMRTGVRVSCIEPTVIETPLLDKASDTGEFRTAINGFGEPPIPVEQAAEVVWRAAHEDALHYPVGAMPAMLLQEITPRIEASRARYREAMAS